MLELDSQSQPELLHIKPRRLPVDPDALADRACVLCRKLVGFSISQVLRIDREQAVTGLCVATSCLVVIPFNNGSGYRGDEVNEYSSDPPPTVLARGGSSR